MRRGLVFIFCAILMGVASAEDKLPIDPEASFDIEPPLLIKDRAPEPIPESNLAAKPIASTDLDQLQVKLESATRSAAAADRLWKMGVLAKVEAENRELRVVRLQADVENARLERAKEQVVAERLQFQAGEISKADLDLAESAVASAATAAKTTIGELQRAELEAAMLDVRRQQKLLDLGSGRKSAVNRAEERLAALKANN